MNQLREWQDHYTREPFGFPADDYLQAMSSLTAARVGGSKRAKLSDFMMPKHEEITDDMDPNERLYLQVTRAFARNIKDAKLNALPE